MAYDITEQISTMTTDGTIGYTVLMFAVAFMVALMALAFFGQAMLNWRKRADTHQFYLDNVIAFKVGYIKKTATEKGIDLSYRPKSDLMEKLEEEVSNDLSTSS